MEVSYIPIAKARGFTTHWIIGCSRSTVANYMKQIRLKEEEEKA